MKWLLASGMVFSGVMTIYILSRLFCTNIHLADPLEEAITGENLKTNDNYQGKRAKNIAALIVNIVPLEQFESIKILSNLINKLMGESVGLSMAFCCLYISVDMNQIFLERSQDPKYYSYVALWIMYNLVQIPTVILSAEICRQVCK